MDVAKVEVLCPRCISRVWTEGWVTVAGEALERAGVQREAKRLSKALAAPVLSVEYVDDDYLELALYSGGRRVFRHIPAPYEDILRQQGKAEPLIKALGLSEETAKKLWIVLREQRAEVTVKLFECLLNCVLWVDERMCGEALSPTPESYLEEYLSHRAEKAAEKIENQTQMCLMEKLEGIEILGGYPFVAWQRDEDTAPIEFWSAGEDDRLHRQCAVSLPGLFPSPLKYYHMPCEDKYRMFLLGFSYCSPEEREKPEPQWEFILDVVGNGGEVLMSLDRTDTDGWEYACLLDEHHLYYRKSCYHIPSGVQEWSLPVTGGSRSGPLCVLPKGRFAVVSTAYDTITHNNLTVFDRAGNSCAACSFAGVHDGWDRVLMWGEHLLYLYSDEACRIQLVCLDMALAEEWRIMLAEDGMPMYAEAELDAGTGMLYLQLLHPSEIIAVHLPERRITAVRQLEQGSRCRLTSRMEGMGPVVELGSTVEILDQELRTISCHRIRGEILQYIPRDGRLQIVSYIRSKYKTIFQGGELIFKDTRQACAFLYTLKEKRKKRCSDR